MYKHFLVPLDGTELSMGNIASAVELAHSLAAKVTFCHVTPDYGPRRAAERLRYTDAEQARAFERDADANARAHANDLMTKARASAAARGVACDTVSVAGPSPAASISQTAVERGCDLIVMASHAVTGLRTLFRSSLTSKVLREAPLPVLITRIEANDPQAEASRACALVQDEHRSLVAVIQGMTAVVAEARHGTDAFDAAGFALMLKYVRDFPERLHHPAEERTLHRLLRRRDGRIDLLLDRLESQHQREYGLVAALATAASVCPPAATGSEPALVSLEGALATFAVHVWEHLETEERNLLPLALDILEPKDWSEVATAFEGNRDPGYGGWSREEFRRHFTTVAGYLDARRSDAEAT